MNVMTALIDRFPRLPDFISLARLDRPIGIYLLLWPTLTGLWFAAEGWPGWHLFFVFTFGAVLTRSAGCIINDIVDRNFDGRVRRTRERPLARNRIDVVEALLFMGALLFAALILVLTTNLLTVMLAFVAATIAAIYPLMKRYTYLPQAILGIAFSMGIPMAFSATTGSIPLIAWLLVTGNVVWTVAYDTEYAMVDRDDDIKLGLRSSAILFGELDRIMIGLLQVLFLLVLVFAGRQIEATWAYYLGLTIAALLFCYQQLLIRDRNRDGCLAAFLNNHWAGLAVFTGVIVNYLAA